MADVVIKVGGMSCQGCVKNITGVLGALDGVQTAEVSLERGEACVTYDPARVDAAAMMGAIEDAGFDAGPA
jgi:copper chaperone